jgi:hypothetical protein
MLQRVAVLSFARSWLVLRVLLMGGCIGKAAPEARLTVGEPVIAMREERSRRVDGPVRDSWL